MPSGARASGGLPGPGRTRRGAEPLYSPFWASKRESVPVAVLLIPPVIETTPYRTDTSYSMFHPRNPRVPAQPEHAERLGLPGVDTALYRLRFDIGMYCKRREGDPFGEIKELEAVS